MQQKPSALLIFVVVIAAIGAGIIISNQFSLAGIPLSSPDPAGFSTPVSPATTPRVPDAIPVPTPGTKITQQEAAARLEEEDIQGYSVAGVTLTDRYPARTLYEFTLVPDKTSFRETNATAFIDAKTGDPWTPLQDDAGITIEQAKEKARGAFPGLSPDRVRIRFYDGSQYMRSWDFELMKGEEKLVEGGLDADTGELRSYAFGVARSGRPEAPSVTMETARLAADREIRERNGELPLIPADARLDPLGMPGEKIAGQYVFVYKRVIRGVACDSDGLTITVDSVAGKVVSYQKMWSLPENAVALPAEPLITNDTAAATVRKEAEKVYPASAAGLKIVSADLRWMDFHNPDRMTPGPGTVPLAWVVQFDDDSIRAQPWPVPANGRVDARNGTLLSLYYRHQD